MNKLVKFEGRIEQLEIYNEMMSTLGTGGDSQILSSALLSGASANLTLSAQTVFVASHSRLHIQAVVAKINGKICLAKFHRALLEQDEFVVCVARHIEDNVYEVYSMLSPKTGLLHMQVGMGASKTTYTASALKGAKFIFFCSAIMSIFLFIYVGDYSFSSILIWLGVLFVFYFINIFIMKRVIRSLLHLSEKSEEIFEAYGFLNPKEVFLLPSRHISEEYKVLLDGVFDYRKIIQDDPYPASYIEKQESSHG
ncbi:putative type VI secretion system effector [Acinetobacter bereziniae]